MTAQPLRRVFATALGAIALAAAMTACGAENDTAAPTTYSRPNSHDWGTTTAAAPTLSAPTNVLRERPQGTDEQGFIDSPARCDGADRAVLLVIAGGGESSLFAVCADAFTGRYLRAFARGEGSDLDEMPPRVPMRGTFFTDTANSVQFMVGDAKVDIAAESVTIVWPQRDGTTRTTSWAGIQRWLRA